MKFAVFIILFFLFFIQTPAQSPPQVSKIEPPNWWANQAINPVRLLIHGTNLQGASVRATKSGAQADNIRVNPRGDYLFVDINISPNAKPGSYPLEITTANGKTTAPFEILAPLDANTHFQGITNDDVIYLIMTDRFSDGDVSNNKPANSPKTANDRNNPRGWHGGDFRGIKNHLDYLKELGITAIWLTPWYDNSNAVTDCPHPWCPATSYHGYGAIDYYGTEDHFGTFADLRELVEAAHKVGIKVIQDQVANHVSSEHQWAKNPPLDDWFSPFAQNTFNNSVLLSPNASQAELDNLLHGWFNESLPDMNQDEPEVARYEIQNALWWIGATGVDGIREDTIQYMPRAFIRDWSTAILKQYPRFWMVGEVFETDSAQTAFFQGGKTGWDGVDTKLPSDFDFNLWRTSFDVFSGKKPMRALRDVLKYDGLYPNVNHVTTISGNHDTDRFMSLDGATEEGAMLHLAFLLSARGIPQIYYGEEIGMRGGGDPDNRRDFAGGWAEDTHSAFTKEGRTPEEQKMFEWTRDWINLRRKANALKIGKTTDRFYDNEVYVMQRGDFTGRFLLAFNLSKMERNISFNVEKRFDVEIIDTIIGEEGKVNFSNSKVSITLPPKSATAYKILTNRQLQTD